MTSVEPDRALTVTGLRSLTTNVALYVYPLPDLEKKAIWLRVALASVLKSA